MPDFDDEDQTRVTCPACGGDTRRDCELCQGHGSVTAAQAAGWRFERANRILAGSGEHRIELPHPPLERLPDEGHHDGDPSQPKKKP